MTSAPPRYDLLIRGGRLIDPAAGIDRLADVAIDGDRVAAVDDSIPSESATRVIDATGRLVTPGLIDLHAHLFRGADYFGIDPDSLAWRSGVTTWLDAGSAGGFRIPAFEEHVVRPARVRIKALINVSYLGLSGLNYDEYCNPKALNIDVLSQVARHYPDLIVGIKARIGKEGVCYPGLRPLRAAIEAAEVTGLPVICHISDTPPSVERVLSLLRPDDVITHSYTGAGERLIDDVGRVRPAARRARQRGVRYDIGHGAGSFSFASAEALSGAGFWPDSISTNLHQLSVAGPRLVEDQAYIGRVRGDGSPQLTLLTVMTKFLFLGWPVADVIRAVTATPAAIFGWTEVGTLRPGALADVAILEVVDRRHELLDIYGNARHADREFVCHATLVGGRELERLDVPPPPPWIRLVDREPSAQLPVAVARLQDPRVRRLIAFHEPTAATATTPAAWLERVAAELSASQSHVPVPVLLTGTDGDFAELNRDRPDRGPAHGLAYAMNPQVHAFDELSLIESLQAQADTVRTARSFAGDGWIAVTPITLRQRFNPAAEEPSARAAAEPPTDDRQPSLFAAGWLLGSIASLAAAGADSATYFETAGPRGVIGPSAGGDDATRLPAGVPYPAWFVLADLADRTSMERLTIEPSGGPVVSALAMRGSNGTRVLLANLGMDEIVASVGDLPGDGARVRILGTSSPSRSCCSTTTRCEH